MEGITNDQAHRLAEEALAKSKAEDHIKFQNTLYQINAGIKTYAEKGYKVFEETLSGSKFDYVEVDRLRDILDHTINHNSNRAYKTYYLCQKFRNFIPEIKRLGLPRFSTEIPWNRKRI